MKIVPVIDTETGDAMLRVIKQPLTGHLSDTHFAYGEMKLTYRVRIQSHTTYPMTHSSNFSSSQMVWVGVIPHSMQQSASTGWRDLKIRPTHP